VLGGGGGTGVKNPPPPIPGTSRPVNNIYVLPTINDPKLKYAFLKAAAVESGSTVI